MLDPENDFGGTPLLVGTSLDPQIVL